MVTDSWHTRTEAGSADELCSRHLECDAMQRGYPPSSMTLTSCKLASLPASPKSSLLAGMGTDAFSPRRCKGSTSARQVARGARVTELPSSPGTARFVASPWSRGCRHVVAERKRQLSDIRATDIEDYCGLEDSIPIVPESSPCVQSNPIQSEEFWQDVIGNDAALSGTCKWIESTCFDMLVVCTIVTQALLVGFEDKPFLPLKWHSLIMELILLFSIFELAVRTFRWRIMTSKGATSMTLLLSDWIAVCSRVIEQWGMVWVYAFDISLNSRRFLDNLTTILRMLWLLRFLRLINISPGLHELAHGVLDALQGLFWVLIFMLLFLYALAIMCTRLIGRSDLDIGSRSEMDQEDRDMFCNVPTSIFFLFETMSSWSLMPLIPLFQVNPAMRVWFSFFYIYAGWTLLAVMTGTVSFRMLASHAELLQGDDRELERRQAIQEVLLDVFERLDADGSGELSFAEFQVMLRSREVIQLVASDTNIKLQDLHDLWGWCDDNNTGSVTAGRFIQGFQWLSEPVNGKMMLKLQENMSHQILKLQRRVEVLMTSNFNMLEHQINPPLRKIHAVTEQVQMLAATFKRLRQSIEASQPYGAGNSCTLGDVERRLIGQIDQARARVDRFVPMK